MMLQRSDRPKFPSGNLPIGRRMEITGADLLTIAAKIAIISDISVCMSLLFCENTRNVIRTSACLEQKCARQSQSTVGDVCLSQSATTNELPPTKIVSFSWADLRADCTASGTWE